MPTTKMNMVLGIDFDNTIIHYDHLFYDMALAQKLIPKICPVNKTNIRDHIRKQASGETDWQGLQAKVYGTEIQKAFINDGVVPFIKECRLNQIPVYVVSHKTEFAAQDSTNTNLRCAALNWMVANSFFEFDGLGFLSEDIYFETTKIKKIERIIQLGCTHFIDDLIETFQEKLFPKNINKLLFSKSNITNLPNNTIIFRSWQEIHNELF
jgi:hypothetical protein